MVEPQIVVLDVAGSSPVGHPTASLSGHHNRQSSCPTVRGPVGAERNAHQALRFAKKTIVDEDSDGARQGSSLIAASSWASCCGGLRPPGAGSDDASRRPVAIRSPSPAPMIPPAAGLDCRGRAIGAAGLDGNIRSRIQEAASADVHGIRSLDRGILAELNLRGARRKGFAREISVRLAFARCPYLGPAARRPIRRSNLGPATGTWAPCRRGTR